MSCRFGRIAAVCAGAALAEGGAASVIGALFHHPLTDKGIAGFMAKWAKSGQSIV